MSPKNPQSYRRYATLEESEAVLPVFTTPTNMYTRNSFTPQPRFTSSPNTPSARYTSSPRQSTNQPRTQAFDPLYSSTSSSTSSPTFSSQYRPKDESIPRNNDGSPSTQATDEMVAQLVAMGFSALKARVAVDASGGKDLQEALDILVQNANSSDEEGEEEWRKQQEERKKEYLDEMRQKVSPSVRPSSPSDPAAVYANNERKQGNLSFNQGRFIDAEKSYTLAINALPAGHSDLALLLNNRAAAYMKQGKFKECLEDCTLSVDIARRGGPVGVIMQETSTTVQAQLLKALHRKACAFEGLCQYQDAIQTYEEYIRLDGSRNTQITQGIQRCKQALSSSSWKPTNGNESAFPNIDISIFMTNPKPQLTQAEIDEINNSKAVKEMRDREKQKEAEETEKLLKEDQVDAQISAWKNGREKNLRSLLSSLELILWPGVQWKPVLASDIIDVKKCKITYMKAIAKVHPDKVSANATVEQRMMASRVFTILNQAWDIFRTENNL